MYAEYKKYQVQFQKAMPENTVIFSTYYFKGFTADQGSCSDWKNYINTQLILPYDNLYFSQVTLSSKFRNDGNSGNPSYRNRITTRNSTCDNPVFVQGFMDAIRTGVPYEAPCAGVSWRVFTCNGQRVMCLNCKLTCIDSESCPGNYNYMVNPCQSSCANRAVSYGLVGFTYKLYELYPKFSVPLSVVAAKNFISVTANVTSAGRIYCAAFISGTSIKDLAFINQAGTPGFMQAPGIVSIKIKRLGPDTFFDVYCYTEDFNSHLMPMEEIIANKITAKTLCCRSVLFMSTFPRIPDRDAGGGNVKFGFVLSSFPAAPLLVKLTMKNFVCADKAIGKVKNTLLSQASPSVFNFSQNSPSLVGHFSILGYQGCFWLTATAFSSSGADAYVGSNASITIVNPNVFQPDVPTLSRVVFSKDGQNLLFYFSVATDRPSGIDGRNNQTLFYCDSLVDFGPVTQLAQCIWVDSNVLRASMTSFSARSVFRPLVGDSVAVKGEKIRPACFGEPVSCLDDPFMLEVPLGKFIIEAPEDAVYPTVSLSSSAIIGSCDDIVLDPTASTGNGGRPWFAVEWKVSVPGKNESLYSQMLVPMNMYLNTVSAGSYMYDGTQLVSLSRNYFRSFNGTLLISLTLNNFMGKWSVGSVSVTVSSLAAVPRLSIPGPAVIVKYRWQPISLTAVATIPACAGAVSEMAITYVWKVYQGPNFVPSLKSSSLDQRVFKLPPFSLESSTSYIVQVTALGYSATGINQPKSVYGVLIQTGSSGIMANIAGGTMQTAASSDTIVLDASASFDMDAPPSTPSELMYTWYCVQYSPNYGYSCGGGFSNNSTTPNPLLTLPPRSLMGSKFAVYNFTVKVTNSVLASATSSVLLSVLNNEVPRVNVARVQSKYNPESKITLVASVKAPLGSVSVAWSSDALGSLLNENALTPLLVNLPQGASQVALSLPGNVLTPGVSYSFSIKAMYDSAPPRAIPGVSTVTIIVNQPPSGGLLAVAPLSGDAMQSKFLFQALTWTDDPADYPLQYLFAYFVYRSDSQIVVRPRSEISYSSVTLGQGRADNNQVTCVLNTSDTYGASAMATLPSIKVYPITSLVALKSIASDAFTRAFQNSDPTSISQVLTGVAAALSLVDCSVPVPCVQINRIACSTTSRTCGSCMPNFVGIPGDSNVPCALSPLGITSKSKLATLNLLAASDQRSPTVSASMLMGTRTLGNSNPFYVRSLFTAPNSTLTVNHQDHDWNKTVKAEVESFHTVSFGHRKAIDTSTRLLSPGATCVRGSAREMCISGVCTNGVCTESLQSCPNSCSNKGACVYIDQFGASVLSTQCLLQNKYCFASCVCYQGFYGSDCSLAKSPWTTTSGLKAGMCTNIARLVLIQDVTADIITTRANLLNEILRDLSLLSDSALDTCLGILISTIDSAPLQELVGETSRASLFFSALSKVLALGLQMSASTRSRVSEALQTLLTVVQASMALGELPFTVSEDSLRVTTAIILPVSMQSTAFSTPVSDFETFVGTTPSIVSLDPSNVPAGVKSVGVTLLQFTRNPTRARTNSSILTLQTVLYTSTPGPSGSGISRRRLISLPVSVPPSVVVTLQNYAPITYNVMPISTRVHQCYRKREGVYTVSAVCPDGSSYSVRCPGVKGVFTVTCPSHKDQPRCEMWDSVSASFIPAPSCRLLSYTPQTTKCACNFSVIASSSVSARFHRRLGSSNVLEQSFSASMEVISTALEQSYEAAPPLIEQRLDSIIQPTMWGLFGVCALLLILMVRVDIREISAAHFVKLSDGKAVRTAFGFFEKLIPEEFAVANWHVLFYERLCIEHSFLGMFSQFRREGDLRVVRAATLLGNFLSIVFISTVLAGAFFSDDGSCEFIGDVNECVSLQTPLSLRFSCEWHDFNSSCGFKAPVIDALGVMLYAAVILLATVPIGKSLETLAREAIVRKQRALDYDENPFPWLNPVGGKRNIIVPVDDATDGYDKHFETLVDAQSEGSLSPPVKSSPSKSLFSPPRSPTRSVGDKYASSIQPSIGGSQRSDVSVESVTKARQPQEEYWERCDELSDAQTLTTTLLHAARLRKLQEYTDYVLPMLEVDMLIHLNKSDRLNYGRQLLITESKESALLYKSETVKRARYTLFEPSKDVILNKLLLVRGEADRIKNEMELMRHNEEQEEFLIKMFVLDNVQGYRNRIAFRYMLGEGRYESPEYAGLVKIRRYVCGMLWVVFVVLMMVYVIEGNQFIGSRASALWVLNTVSALVLELVLRQPLCIWARWVGVNSFVAKDIRQIFTALSTRFVSIVQRKAGAMRDANNLVQHFNPACRAARQFPHLPVSRFLLAINDYDVPHFAVEGIPLAQKHGRDLWFGILCASATAFLHYITLLPAPFQDCMYELMATLLLEVVVILLVVIGSVSPGLAVFLALCFPGALGLREWWKRLLQRRASRRREQKQSEDEILYGYLNVYDIGKSPSKRPGSPSRPGTSGSVRTKPGTLGTLSPSNPTRNVPPPPGAPPGLLSPLPSMGKEDAYLVDNSLRAQAEIDATAKFNSKFKPTKGEITKRWIAYKSPLPSVGCVLPLSGAGTEADAVDGESKNDERLGPLELPTTLQHGGGGLFGAVREKPRPPFLGGARNVLPPLEAPPNLAETIARLEHSITLNLESVIRETLSKQQQSSQRGRRKAHRERKEKEKERERDVTRESAGGEDFANIPDLDDGDGDRTGEGSPEKQAFNRRRRRKAKGDETAGPGGNIGDDIGMDSVLRPSTAPVLDADPEAFPALPDLYHSPKSLLGPGSPARLNPNLVAKETSTGSSSEDGGGRREDPAEIMRRVANYKLNAKALDSNDLTTSPVKITPRKKFKQPTDAIFAPWHQSNYPAQSNG